MNREKFGQALEAALVFGLARLDSLTDEELDELFPDESEQG